MTSKRLPQPKPNDQVQVDRRETLILGYNDFLKRYDWSWFGTLMLASGRPTAKQAEKRFNEWIGWLRAEEGTTQFRWVRIIEPGRGRGNPHIHFVLAGLQNRRMKWQQRWNQLGGNAQIDVYDANQNGLLYILKTMEDSGEIDVDFNFGNQRDEK